MTQPSTPNVPSKGLASLISDRPASFLLSLVSGFVDTAGFIALFGLFTAHVTGNLLLAGASIVQAENSGVVSRLTMIPVFMASVVLTSLIARTARRQGRSVLAILLTSEALALGVFMVVGSAMEPALRLPEHEMAVTIVGATGVVAMGIQNTLMREAASNLPPTTVMTGNLTQFTLDCLQSVLLSSRPLADSAESEAAKARHRLARYIPTLVGFVLGAACGAYAVAQFQFWSIFFPLFIVGLLSIAAVRSQSLPTTSSLKR